MHVEKYPSFNDQGLDRIQKEMQNLCNDGFYKDLAWEIGSLDKNKKKTIVKTFIGQSGIRADANSYWRIYSMTKPLVTVVTLRLIEEGKLRLFDHISRFLPNFKNSKLLVIEDKKEKLIPSTNPINIFHLLTHTSGLSYGFLPGAVSDLYRKEGVLADGSISLEDEAKKISKLPLTLDPGSSWQYSVSTDVLAYILECITDMPLNEILDKYLFKKLGMVKTSFDVPEKESGHLLPCFGGIDIFGNNLKERNIDIFSSNPTLDKVEKFNSYPQNSNGKFRRGGHGLFCTLDDYSSFAANMLNYGKGILNRKSMELLLTDHTTHQMKPLGINKIYKPSPGLNGDGFGFGMRIRGSGNGSLLFGTEGEFGWGGAAETLFFVDPKENFYAVFLAQNLDNPGASTLFKQLVYSSLN